MHGMEKPARYLGACLPRAQNACHLSGESGERVPGESGGWVLALKPLERCRGLGIAVEHELADCDGVESRWLGLVKKSL